MKGLIKVRGIWQIELMIDGHRLRKSTGTEVYDDACEILKAERAKFMEKHGLKEPEMFDEDLLIEQASSTSPGSSRPFSVAAAYALKTVWADKATYKEIRQKVKLLIELLGDPDIKDITTPMLEDLKFRLLEGEKGRKNGERAARTVNKYLRVVTRVLRNEVYLGNLQYTPPFVELKAESKKRILTKDEIKSLISYFDQRDEDFADAVKVLLDTGMRTGELSQLYAYHVNFKENCLSLERMKTKSGKERIIPMTKRVRGIMLRRIKGPHSKIFPYNHPDNYKNRWVKWRRTQPGGMQDKALTPHILRHTFCTLLLAAGNSIYAVQRWMGHAQITTTEVYLSLIPGELKEAVKKLEEYIEQPNTPETTRKVIKLRRIK